MYHFRLFDMIRKHPHRSEYIFTLIIITWVHFNTKKTRLVLLLSLRSVSGAFFILYSTPCIFMWRCPRVVLMELSRFFLMRLSDITGYGFRNPYLVAFSRLLLVGPNIAERYNLAS